MLRQARWALSSTCHAHCPHAGRPGHGAAASLGAAVSSAGYFGYKFLFLVLAMELHFGVFSTFQ